MSPSYRLGKILYKLIYSLGVVAQQWKDLEVVELEEISTVVLRGRPKNPPKVRAKSNSVQSREHGRLIT